jgi:hypothetical protein
MTDSSILVLKTRTSDCDNALRRLGAGRCGQQAFLPANWPAPTNLWHTRARHMPGQHTYAEAYKYDQQLKPLCGTAFGTLLALQALDPA